MGVKGLNRCQRRWRKHVSPQRELEMQTSTENTAPDIQMSLCLLTDGTKQELTRGQRLAERQREEIKATEEEFGTTESLLDHLDAAHAIEQDVREMRIEEER